MPEGPVTIAYVLAPIVNVSTPRDPASTVNPLAVSVSLSTTTKFSGSKILRFLKKSVLKEKKTTIKTKVRLKSCPKN